MVSFSIPKTRKGKAKQRRYIKRAFKKRMQQLSYVHHMFKRTAQQSTNDYYSITLDGDVSTAGSLVKSPVAGIRFQLDDVSNSTDIKNNYDRYQIVGAKVRFYWSPARGLDSSGNVIPSGFEDSYAPVLRYHVDRDDSGSPSYETIANYQPYKEVRLVPSKDVNVYITKPSVLVMLYETLTSTGYGPKAAPVINTSDSNVLHYGLKYAVKYPNLGSGATLGKVEVSITYYIKAINPQT